MDDNGSLPQQLTDVGAYIREQRRNAQLSLRKLAERSGVSNPYLSQIERGLRQPSAKILKGIAGALQVSAETLFTQAGILDGEPQDGRRRGGVLRSIFADPELTDGQRRELAETYERMRSETAERRARRNAIKTEPVVRGPGRYRRCCMSAIETGLYVAVGAADLAAEKVRELPAVKELVERSEQAPRDVADRPGSRDRAQGPQAGQGASGPRRAGRGPHPQGRATEHSGTSTRRPRSS